MRAMLRRTMIALLLAAGTTIVSAAEWKIDPTIRFRTGYDDNIRIKIGDKISSAIATLSPSANFSVETPQSGLSGNLNFDFRRYEEDNNLNEDNVRLLINSFHRTERSEVRLGVGLIKDNTLDSQLSETGVVFDRVPRYSVNASPNWTYKWSERTLVSLNYQYRDIRYKDATGTAFVDFAINSGDASLQRVISERTMASITLSYSRSNNENNVESGNTNLQAGASYRFSETLSSSLFVGVRYTETDFSRNSLIPIFSGDTIIGFIPLTQDISNSNSGYTFNGNLTRAFLRGEAVLAATRSISSGINGLPIEVTQLSWNNLYRFNGTLSANLNLQLYSSKYSNSAGGGLNRNYYTIEPRFSWDFEKFWSLSGSYRYRKQTFDGISNNAIQNAAYLTLAYRWPKIAASR